MYLKYRGSLKEVLAKPNALGLGSIENLQQPNPGGTVSDPDHSGMKPWVTPSDEPQLAEVPAQGEGNTEQIVEEGLIPATIM